MITVAVFEKVRKGKIMGNLDLLSSLSKGCVHVYLCTMCTLKLMVS